MIVSSITLPFFINIIISRIRLRRFLAGGISRLQLNFRFFAFSLLENIFFRKKENEQKNPKWKKFYFSEKWDEEDDDEEGKKWKNPSLLHLSSL